MNRAVGIFDVLSLAAMVFATVFAVVRCRHRLRHDVRVILFILFGFMLFHNLSNSLEWVLDIKTLDLTEDYLEILEFAMWGGFFYVFAQDVGGRKLRASEERYRTLVDNIDLGISLIDSNLNIVMTNAAQGKAHNRPAKEFIRKKCFAAFENRLTPCVDCPGLVAMDTGQPAMVEHEGEREDGSSFPVRVRAFPVFTDDGRSEGFIEVVEDISGIKQAEEDRLQFQAQVQHAQKLESLGVLAGGIAHDFNNLLVAVMGNADLVLADLPGTSPVRRHIEEIRHAAVRASELTNQMLAYSGKGNFFVAELNLNDVIQDMVELLGVSIGKKVRVRYKLDDQLPLVRGDVSQIRQIVMNLITNASDAAGDHVGTITIATRTIEADADYLAGSYLNEALPEGVYACLNVTDDGCGMDEEVRAKLFDPFFSTKFTGRGLGMAAVLGIVRGHRGAVRVYSEPGQGTSIKVLLPAAPGWVAPPTEAAKTLAADWRGEGTVLLVDDDEAVRSIGARMLQSRGFDVVTAVNGREAVDVFAKQPDAFVAVLLDMTMPEMSGEEAFDAIRRIRPDARVVLMSGYTESDVTSRLGDRGLAGFVQKPFGTAEVVDAIRAALIASV